MIGDSLYSGCCFDLPEGFINIFEDVLDKYELKEFGFVEPEYSLAFKIIEEVINFVLEKRAEKESKKWRGVKSV